MISIGINDKLRADYERLSALFDEEETELPDRLAIVTIICDKYALDMGMYYDGMLDVAEAEGRSRASVPLPAKDKSTLYQMANLLLYTELSDKSSNKSQKYEYPILSDNQLRRRIYGMHERDGSDGFKEVTHKAAFTIGTDLIDYRYPFRTYLSVKTQTDIAMKGGKSSDVISYNINDRTSEQR